MSAKNSGVTREQYAAYDKEKGPQPQRVTLEVWKIEDKKPDQDATRGKVVAWDNDGCVLMDCEYIEIPYESPYWMLDNGYRLQVDGTSWAYIPNITTEEAAT